MHYGHRHVTMLVYLNSVPEANGGYTAFPKLNMRLNPRAHAAIVFNDCLPNGEEARAAAVGRRCPRARAQRTHVHVMTARPCEARVCARGRPPRP